MPSNCGTGEDSWESLGLKGDQTTLMAESENELESLDEGERDK